ncbi:FxsB family cyclophane-forming radical SAM/SPASM peptide maturase [Actinoallomurus sp. NPDC050550]|uniref:FxsB family cyclophane-forming radical SAM/SPASM peptide maturase n=1 Tax=Actinoallomurus sp. NPDC050550 TaxID=3154937 RepID=UPI0033FCCA90
MTVNLGQGVTRSDGEWPADLDVAALRAGGWRPTPFREFVLKIHSRCDLACDYCYMYEMADQSWRSRPRRMSRTVLDQTARRIAEHVHAHGLDRVKLVLHGGEPLLAGAERLAYAVRAVRTAVGSGTSVDVRVQTNAVRLNTAFLRIFDELDVTVAVSLDGDEAAHDRHRRRPDGRGSHAAVRAGLALLTGDAFRHLFAGLLSTIDLHNPPVRTYEALLAWNPPQVDFLLPHGNWSAPPPGRTPGSPDTPYADWLIAVFDRWYDAPRQETRVRTFAEIMQLLLGGASRTENVGLSPVATIVVETDGALEQVSALKSAFPGAPATGLHVERDPFDTALLLPSVAARQSGLDALAPACRSCALRRVCGGGLYVHRYRAGNGFANPSVYCPDMFRLIEHVRDRVRADLTARAARQG